MVIVLAPQLTDDLEKLSLPAETNFDLDLLAWWKMRDHSMPTDPAKGQPEGLPHLAKMARQFLGRRPRNVSRCRAHVLQGWQAARRPEEGPRGRLARACDARGGQL